MKISTSLQFDRAMSRIGTLQDRLVTSQARIAASTRILSPSDAPEEAAAIQRLRGAVERQDSQIGTLQIALNHYAAEEGALGSASDLLIRFKELAIQAANHSQWGYDRKAIAVEMSALRDQLVSLGNTRDDSGNYLFSGTRVGTPAFATGEDGAVVYQGDQTHTRIPAGVERSVQYIRSGTDVFIPVERGAQAGEEGAVRVGFFDALDDLITAVSTDSNEGMQRGIGELDQMHAGIAMALVQTGADQSVVQTQVEMLDETAMRLKSTLSDIEDLDYSEALIRMNKEMLALEAAMGSFAKISGLSLFDYLRG